MDGLSIHITGIVQGVGFRPFVYGLAVRYALVGWVRNTSAGVDIEVDGPTEALEAFAHALQQETPPLAKIDTFDVMPRTPNGFAGFEIVLSQGIPGAFQPISPDVSICPDCLRELFDPADPRYRYPFINCTNCGPRFTIIQDIPYDRPKTTMAPFEMCAYCRGEYEDPLNRRFHAQPVACPVCGPRIWIEDQESKIENHQSPITNFQSLISAGHILAIKGLGGFHLACNATNPASVAELRRRKLRREKPFAVMMPDLATVERHCFVSEAEREQLESRARPIVLLQRRPESPIAAEVAPRQHTLGVMLPYTPLHYLLFSDSDLQSAICNLQSLVMTSGNLSEEPIAHTNEDARTRLAPLADAFLMHNREIHVRCDDSVVRVSSEQSAVGSQRPTVGSEHSSLNTEYSSLNTAHSSLITLRRSRGYAPGPISLPWDAPPLLAAGAELKNAFCLAKGRYAFLSHHVGDLENYETLQSFEEGAAHFERLFRVKPEMLAYDLHPNYLATRYALVRAEQEGLPAIGVQHHHAHIAACMAEHGLTGERPVIGVSFDGTGYGDDGAIWGGEFLLADYAGYRRIAHLAYVPLPGGDKAIKEPWRIALAHLHRAEIEWAEDLAPVQYAARSTQYGVQSISILRHQLANKTNAPDTSSMGRLFDAAAALLGVRQVVNYEAQAAIELEALADPAETAHYPFAIHHSPFTIIDPAPLFHKLTADLRADVPVPRLAARFHNSVASMVFEVCRAARDQAGINEVALSGGVWQNMTLLAQTVRLLHADNFTVYQHSKIPANDGGLALGQAAIARAVQPE